MIANYHTHTFRCGHAGDYTDEEYVIAAIKNGFQIMGFTDHTPWPYDTGFQEPRVRMHQDKLSEYIASVRALQEKYKDRIRIYLGVECEYFPKYIPWLQEQKKKMDYLILGNHYRLNNEDGGIYFGRASKPEDVIDYVTFTVEGMKTGMFSYLAHPDVVFRSYPSFGDTEREWSYILCQNAKELNIPLEYNLLGLQRWDSGEYQQMGYPLPQFWEIAAQVGCKAIIGLDAHCPQHYGQKERIARVEGHLESLGMEIVETLPGLE